MTQHNFLITVFTTTALQSVKAVNIKHSILCIKHFCVSLKLIVLKSEVQTKWKQVTIIRNYKINHVQRHEFSVLNITFALATEPFGAVAGNILPLSKLQSISLSDCSL